MSEELLYDFSQLFYILQLDYLPTDNFEEDIEDNAVIEYYNYIANLERFDMYDRPEFTAGMKALRKLLSDLSKQENNISGVWKAMTEIESDYSLLRIAIPLIPYMWD